MSLKRYLTLAAGVLLFALFFVFYFNYCQFGIEGHFRDARKNFGVENAVLVAAASPDSSTKTGGIPSTPEPAPAAPVDPSAAPVSPDAATTPGGSPSPAPAATPDGTSPTTSAPSSTAPETTPPAPSTPEATPPVPSQAAPMPEAAPPSAAPSTPDGTPAVPVMPDSTSVPPAPATNAAPTPPSSTMVSPKLSWLPLLEITAATGAPATSAPTAPVSAPAAESSTNSTITPAEPLRAAPVQASVIILGYHQFTGPGIPSKNIYSMQQDIFEQEMKYLHDNGYNVVPLSDVVRFIKHEIGLPPNSVAITIDDGYKSPILWAAPVLKKYGYPWTFFIYPQFITNTPGKGAASWPELLQLQSEGVDIESHTMTHPFLTHKMGKTPEQYDAWLENETAGSKALLEKKMGKPILYLAYPYGDYNKEVEAKAIAAGYEAIFTVADNPVHSTTDLHSVGRYVITKPVEKAFAAYLHQGALGIADADPAPGATISNPRPVISAVLGYTGNIDPKSITAEVRNFGLVRYDYDPKTSTIKLYLPRDLIQSPVIVNIHLKDANTGQNMVANWHFNYDPAGEQPSTNAAPQAPTAPATNAPAAAAAAATPKVSAAAASTVSKPSTH